MTTTSALSRVAIATAASVVLCGVTLLVRVPLLLVWWGALVGAEAAGLPEIDGSLGRVAVYAWLLATGVIAGLGLVARRATPGVRDIVVLTVWGTIVGTPLAALGAAGVTGAATSGGLWTVLAAAVVVAVVDLALQWPTVRGRSATCSIGSDEP